MQRCLLLTDTLSALKHWTLIKRKTCSITIWSVYQDLIKLAFQANISTMTSPPKACLLRGPLISLTCSVARCLIGQSNSSCTLCYHSMAVQTMPAMYTSMGGLVVDVTFVTHITLHYNQNQMSTIKEQCYCRTHQKTCLGSKLEHLNNFKHPV